MTDVTERKNKMKLFVASDIHGSALYCRKMLSAFEKSGADKMILLGDLLYHGPRNDLPDEYAPKKVIEMLSAYRDKIISVRGNCEAEVDAMVLPFPVMADYAVIFTPAATVFATHGHLFTPERPINMAEGEIMLSGHTHVPHHLHRDGRIFANPGSVSIPKEGTPHSFMIIDEKGELHWFDLDGTEYTPALRD